MIKTNQESQQLIAGLRNQLKNYFKKHRLQTAVFGKSKGIDSSVVAALLAGIPEVRSIGVIMPCYSEPDDERIAQKVLQHYQIRFIKIDLNKAFDAVKAELKTQYDIKKKLIAMGISYNPANEKIAWGNIKARLRMITLYHIAKLTDGCVIGSGNLSEYMTGFWTLHGDVGDIYPLVKLYKTEIYILAKTLQVPAESIAAEPSDGLDIAGTDEEQLGMNYSQLDQNIRQFLHQKKDINPTALKRIKESEFKRNLPVFLDKQ